MRQDDIAGRVQRVHYPLTPVTSVGLHIDNLNFPCNVQKSRLVNKYWPEDLLFRISMAHPGSMGYTSGAAQQTPPPPDDAPTSSSPSEGLSIITKAGIHSTTENRTPALLTCVQTLSPPSPKLAPCHRA